MGKLLKYLKHYTIETIMAPLFKMLEASFELLVPVVMTYMIDVGIYNRDQAYILKMGGILVLLGVVGLVCSITAQYFAARAAAGFGTELRRDLFSHINSLSHREIDRQGTSTLITRMTNDANQVQSGVNMVLRLFLRSPFIVVGAMVMAFTIDVKGAMVFAVIIPLLSIVVFGIMLISMPLYRKVQNQLDQVLLAVRENLLGVRVIRAFMQQREQIAGFEEKSHTLFKLQLFVGKISALLNPVTYIMINLALALLLWIGAKQVDGGLLTQGQVVALVNYMSQILVELIKLASLMITITKSMACAGRIKTVFEEQPSIADPQTVAEEKKESPFAVEFDHVNFSYENSGGAALCDISFQARRGEVFGIIGGTGSGKSTLVQLIPRFYDTTKGNILVNGIDVRDYQGKQLREKIGMVAQNAILFKGTIRENIRWGKANASDGEILEAMEIAQAMEILQQKKDGLDTIIAQSGKNLSGGQKQRLTIARALVRKPEILILDDSSSALDYATDAKLRKALREKTEDMTVFIVAQRASALLHADQILVLEDGKMAGMGTHRELLKSCDLYREICLSQMTKEEVEGR